MRIACLRLACLSLLMGAIGPCAPSAWAQSGRPDVVSSFRGSFLRPGESAVDDFPGTNLAATSLRADPMAGASVRDADPSLPPVEHWGWTFLPNEILYRSYLGGPREPRLAQQFLYSGDLGWVWELEAGARIGLARFGSPSGSRNPQGFQIDLEGAAFPRLNAAHMMELDAVDFRVGLPFTWKEGPWQAKVEFYHLSSHVGDEFLLRPENRNGQFHRLDYLRDSITTGLGYFVNPDLRLYGEADWAYNTNGGSDPWHFQFGFDYAPVTGVFGENDAPFLAVNGTLRQELNFGGGVNVVAGWMWRGPESGRILRAGVQYYDGSSFQLSFFRTHEELLGFGVWYDF